MSKRRSEARPLPACYAHVIPGLEPVAVEELSSALHAEIKRTARGLVVFRAPAIDDALLQLRTVEDVFALAWGTDQLTYRAEDLEKIRRWTAREADWEQLLRVHQAIRPWRKGRPTYRLVTQMTGKHGYRRVDAREALARGLGGKLPTGWRHVEENAWLEIWLTIHGAMAVCGVRLSDRTMRHRTWKREHLPASLRPTLAAAMVRLADIRPGQVVLDPMCGAGTILAEALEVQRARKRRQETGRQGDRETGYSGAGGAPDPLVPPASVPWTPARVEFWGGDQDGSALHAAGINLRRLGPVHLVRWDAGRLPLPEASVDRIVSNPPFGRQLSSPEEVGPLYDRVIPEYDRVLRSRGRIVLLVSNPAALRSAVDAAGWKRERQFRIVLLGLEAQLSVWRKPG
jgi:23S rRNA G2445 N2-methylase RlmL